MKALSSTTLKTLFACALLLSFSLAKGYGVDDEGRIIFVDSSTRHLGVLDGKLGFRVNETSHGEQASSTKLPWSRRFRFDGTLQVIVADREHGISETHDAAAGQYVGIDKSTSPPTLKLVKNVSDAITWQLIYINQAPSASRARFMLRQSNGQDGWLSGTGKPVLTKITGEKYYFLESASMTDKEGPLFNITYDTGRTGR